MWPSGSGFSSRTATPACAALSTMACLWASSSRQSTSISWLRCVGRPAPPAPAPLFHPRPLPRSAVLSASHARFVRMLCAGGRACQAGFDGMYTYFASHGFTEGSTLSRWPMLASSAAKAGLAFIPSVGPGYIDTAVRPWNAQNTHDRANAQYYRRRYACHPGVEGGRPRRTVAHPACTPPIDMRACALFPTSPPQLFDGDQRAPACDYHHVHERVARGHTN